MCIYDTLILQILHFRASSRTQELQEAALKRDVDFSEGQVAPQRLIAILPAAVADLGSPYGELPTSSSTNHICFD